MAHPRLATLRVLLLVGAVAGARSAVATPAAQLAKGGKALMPVVVSPNASARVRAAASTLAQYLSRIASARFEVVDGPRSDGIAVGLAADFPLLGLDPELAATGPARREQYLIRSHARGVLLVGATDLAVEHATWDLLHRLGHRQFFPGDTWEVVPSATDLRIAVDANEAPAYLARRIWFGFGEWDFNASAHRQWEARNRVTSAFVLNTGHAYEAVIRRYDPVFRAHPEYLGLVGGERKSTKLCASNAAVRALVVRYALDFFAANPAQDSVSIDPSDGGGWCECDACRRLGSPSDRALTLANEISRALEAKHPDKFVAMYAYNEHSPPPTIEARPRVIVNAATAFLKGGVTVEQVIDGWRAKGVHQLGIREYYGVNTWDRDLPGRSRGSNLEYLRRTIPAFHSRGARFLSAESSDGWGPNGLGHYLAARMLWDVRESERLDALKADFLEKAFGPAKAPMARFYALLDGSRPPLLSADLVGRMYRLLEEAGRLASGNAAVCARLDELALYTRYVELFRRYRAAEGEERQAAFEEVIRHAYRISRTMMVHSRALHRDLPARDKKVTVPAEADWRVPESDNPWKQAPPWSRGEIDRIVAAGIARNALAGFEPVAFDEELVPAARLDLGAVPPLQDTARSRGEQTYYTWVERAPATLELLVKGGLIYRDRGNVRVRLYAGSSPQATEVGGAAEVPVHAVEVPPDGEAHVVRLEAAVAGLHRVSISDGGDATEVGFPPGLGRTVKVGAETRWSASGRRSGYFYVPHGTAVVGGYANGPCTIHGGEGTPILKLVSAGEFFAVPVPEGQAGRLWSVRGCAGQVALMTVPPFIAASAEGLLLPVAVVDSELGRAGR
jgi:hypothetical protein